MTTITHYARQLALAFDKARIIADSDPDARALLMLKSDRATVIAASSDAFAMLHVACDGSDEHVAEITSVPEGITLSLHSNLTCSLIRDDEGLSMFRSIEWARIGLNSDKRAAADALAAADRWMKSATKRGAATSNLVDLHNVTMLGELTKHLNGVTTLETMGSRNGGAIVANFVSNGIEGYVGVRTETA